MDEKDEHLDSQLRHIFDQMPGCWGCKDLNSVFKYANKAYAKIIGFSPEKHLDVIGRTDFDMPCATVNCADDFRIQDQTVIEHKKKLEVLDIHPFSGGEWKAYIFTKTPWINKQNQVVGTIFHGADLTNIDILELYNLLPKTGDAPACVEGLQNSLVLTHEYCTVQLSNREAQCLFFLLRGKSVKLISRYLNISSRTVEVYIEKLKAKFGATNRFELHDKALQAGFMNVIPKGLFTTQLSVVLKED